MATFFEIYVMHNVSIFLFVSQSVLIQISIDIDIASRILEAALIHVLQMYPLISFLINHFAFTDIAFFIGMLQKLLWFVNESRIIFSAIQIKIWR